MNKFMAFARGRAFQMRAADAIGIFPRQRQGPGGDPVGGFRAAERTQRNHRAADKVVARRREAGPQADQLIGRRAIVLQPRQECFRGLSDGRGNVDVRNFFHSRRKRRLPEQNRIQIHCDDIVQLHRLETLHHRVQRPESDVRAQAGDARGRFHVAAALEGSRIPSPGRRAGPPARRRPPA